MKNLFFSLIAFLFALNLFAQPSTITYQGVLTNDSGELITGTPAVTFTLYDALTDGNSLWTETHNSVQVSDGLFQVELGSETPFGSLNFAQEMWLQITVGATTLSPRVKFNASGYSINSGSASSATSAISATNIAGGASGSVPYQTASGTTTMLAAGSNGDVLTLAGGVPSWAAPSGGSTSPIVLTRTEDYTITSGDVANNLVILCTASAVTNFTLPTAASAGTGKIVYLTQTHNSQVLNAVASGTDKIYCPYSGSAGASTLYAALQNYYAFVATLVSDGVDKWIVVSLVW